MRKLLLLCLSVVLVGGLIKYTYISNKSKDINYAVENYFTTGIFNEYKMYQISSSDLSFSNGTVAVVKIDGTEKKIPHKKVAYSVFLEKTSRGTWKVKKVYPDEVAAKNEY
ncbi:hypothetical protein P8V03_13850 [Clostridium sp. A1-XYC3]|uniref:DUF4829 domain-containing protein n=1 Tax=Clostridium tanneri TaxID=3037988 RepID=A0ABU4JVP4_9CLOT|nr:hypothetical protein [Clostridium sp. A1-XYC3]MDW8802234.1 hypothetical protein [Clostridium sp. A1-XYC3]